MGKVNVNEKIVHVNVNHLHLHDFRWQKYGHL